MKTYFFFKSALQQAYHHTNGICGVRHKVVLNLVRDCAVLVGTTGRNTAALKTKSLPQSFKEKWLLVLFVFNLLVIC